jgi:riboflavin kinase
MKKCKLDLLILLAKKGGLAESISVSTSLLSKELGGGANGASQQTVSRWLIELEKSGLVEKNNKLIRIAIKGRQKIEEIAAVANESLSKKNAKANAGCEIRGMVTTGFREGKYYIGLAEYKKQLTAKLGFVPFAGTLNIKLSRPADIDCIRRLKQSDGIQTDEFVRDGRSFGRSKCFKVVIDGKVSGALIFPARSHYGDDVVEVIAPVSLRERLKLKDGKEVSIRVQID